MTLSTLRTRLETANEADQAEVLEMAFDVFLPKPSIVWKDNQRTEWADSYAHWQALGVKVGNMMEAKAYESAALLIMREVLPGCDPVLDFIDNVCVIWSRPVAEKGFVPSPVLVARPQSGVCISLAIIAAVCAAEGEVYPPP